MMVLEVENENSYKGRRELEAPTVLHNPEKNLRILIEVALCKNLKKLFYNKLETYEIYI